jgi:hypothetical protein
MARGKITEYQQGAFSKQAVGTPGVDKSGAIIGQGIESIGDALIKRQEASDNLTAMDRFGEYEFQNTQKKFELQKQYQNDPMKYATVAKEESLKLADEFTKGMSGGAARRFKQLSAGSIAQDMEGNAKWAFARDNEIQVGKITSIKQNIALKASAVASPQDLLAIKGDFAAVSPEAQKFISKEEDDKLTKSHWELAKKYAIDAQLRNRPNQFKAELDAKDSPWKDLLDSTEIKVASDQARNAIQNRKIDDIYSSLSSAEGETLDLVKRIDDRSVNLVDLIAKREATAANLGKANTPEVREIMQKHVAILDALLASQTRSMERTDIGKEAKKATLDKFDRDWESFWTEKRDVGKKPDVADLTKELDLHRSLINARNTGAISPNDYNEKFAMLTSKKQLEKKDVGGALPFDQAIEQAGAMPAWYEFWKGKDVLSMGYQEIKSRVDQQYPELAPEERVKVKAELFSQYHQRVKDIPPEQLVGAQNEMQRKAFVRSILLGGTNSAGKEVPGILQRSAFFQDQFTKNQYWVGDSRKDPFGNETVFRGKDSSGQPLWKFKPNSTIKTASGTTLRTNANGDPVR